MESTIPKAHLLALITEQAGEGSAALVADAMADLGMAFQERFTKADFLRVMEAVTREGRYLVLDPEATPGATDADREHMDELLQAVQDHALPVLRLDIEDKNDVG